MRGHAVGKVVRPVGKTGPQQIQQQATATSQRRISSHARKITGGCAAQAMDKQ
jgi:hypothetical protein